MESAQVVGLIGIEANDVVPRGSSLLAVAIRVRRWRWVVGGRNGIRSIFLVTFGSTNFRVFT